MKIYPQGKLLYTGQKELPGVHILKFLCALLVVHLHIPSFSQDILMPVCRTAVPVFFIITGYFLLNSNGEITTDKLKSTIKKLLGITVFSYVCYLIVNSLLPSWTESFIENTFFSYKYWLLLIFNADTAGMGYHLWYLNALLEAILIIYFSVKYNKFSYLYWIIPVGLLLNLAIGTYSVLIIGDNTIPVDFHRNVLTVGLPCIMIGVLLRIHQDNFPSNATIIFGIFIATILLYLEYWFFQSNYGLVYGNITLMTVPLSILLFIFFLRLDVTNPILLKFSDLGKKYSLDIYIWHVLVAMVVVKALSIIGLYGYDAYLAMICTIIFAIIANRLHYKKVFEFHKWVLRPQGK